MPSNFPSYVNIVVSQSNHPPLPAIHTTDPEASRSIIEQSKLALEYCTKFNQHLVYLYYGRPAYRVDALEGPGISSLDAPVCFVLRPESIPNILRAFPFDSGAYLNRTFEPYIYPPKWHISEFALTPDWGFIPRVVTAFFGSNDEYYDDRALQTNPRLNPYHMREIFFYSELINVRVSSKFDDRRSTIELQSSIEINITRENILAVVLPRPLMDDVGETVTQIWKAEPITYPVFQTPMISYIAHIRVLVRNFLEEKAYLSPHSP